MPSILVTGANGQVGCELQYLSKQYPSFTFLFTDVQELDITNQQAVLDFFQQHPIEYCINCAAYTAVDKAESDFDKAFLINVTGTKNLALACEKHQAQLVQISTDYVYHSAQNRPYKETDPTHPQSVYASTKLESDQEAQKICPDSMILRTSWVYSSYGHNFVKTMLRLGKEKETLNIIYDQIGTPTYAFDLAKAILTILEKVQTKEYSQETLSGIFHYSNEGVASWYDFAHAIFDIRDLKCKVNPIETKDYPTPALRPPFSLLDKEKIKRTFDIEIPHWRDSLRRCLQRIAEEYEH